MKNFFVVIPNRTRVNQEQVQLLFQFPLLIESQALYSWHK